MVSAERRRPNRAGATERVIALVRASSVIWCVVAAVTGCDEPQRPWQARPDGSVIDESDPFLPAKRDASTWFGDASFGDAGPDRDDSVELPSPPVSRVGGLWVSCYGHFKPSGHPVPDVTRLGLMCGPVNGMRRLGRTMTGKVAPGKAGAHKFSAKAGECYRVFAVSTPAVENLDVAVLSGQGTRLTADHTEDTWPIVDPERPFCTFHDDTFSLQVSAKGTKGSYALQVWRLPVTRE